MPRKRKAHAPSVEIVPSPDFAQQAANFRRIIEDIVDRKIEGTKQQDPDALLQPWFRSREESHAIKRAQTVPEQQKWSNYFADWGCIICGTTVRAHDSCGMCGSCRGRTVARIESTLRKHAPAAEPRPTFIDNLQTARAALAPSIAALAASGKRRRRA